MFLLVHISHSEKDTDEQKMLRGPMKMIKFINLFSYDGSLLSPPTHTQPILSLFPFKIPIRGKWLPNTALLVCMFFFFYTQGVLVCDCYDDCSHSCGWTTSPPLPERLWTIVLCIMYTSVKTVCLIGFFLDALFLLILKVHNYIQQHRIYASSYIIL